MLQFLSSICFVAFLILLPLLAVLPIALMWRSAAFSGVMLVAGDLLWGRTPTSEDDASTGWLIGCLAVVVGSIVVVRLGMAGAPGSSTASKLPETVGIDPVDEAILLVSGGVVGLVTVLVLANALNQTGGGRLLDLGIAVVAFVAVLIIVQRKDWIRIPIASAGIVVATIAFVGSWQTSNILNQAESSAAGKPWCMTFPATRSPVRDVSELGFFSLPLGNGVEHLGLRIAGMPDSHWSIRQQSFDKGLSGHPWEQTTCLQRTDFAEALREGKLGPNL